MKYNNEFKLKNMHLKNRYIMAPIKTAYGTLQGEVTQRHLTYYENLAKGGISLIIIEPVSVTQAGMEHPKQLTIHRKNSVENLKKIVDHLHSYDVYACLNLNHAGRAANPKASAEPPKAPSSVKCPTTGQTPEELSKREIQEIIEGYGNAILKAQEAGFDAVEIQCGHGYLIQQFLSKRTNKRTDKYGGDKTLFLREVLRVVSENKGNLAIFVRISASEFVDGGFSPEDNLPILRLAQEYNFDAVHCGFGNACDSPQWYYSHMAIPEEKQIEALKKIRSLTKLPLIAAGRMADIKKLRTFHQENIADLIAFGRPLIADPRLPAKLVSGRIEEIVYCGYCLQGCLFNVKNGKGLGCIVNPTIDKPPLEKIAHPKKSAVIGGGPAGISAALTLAKRGHKVTLFEKEKKLGGQFKLAPVVSLKKSMERPLKSLVQQVEHTIKDIRTNHTFNHDDINGFDAYFVATGSKANIPQIEGIENQYMMTGVEFFHGDKKVKGRRILIIGGGMVGIEAAEILGTQGYEIVVTKRTDTIANDMEPITKKLILAKISKHKNIRIMPRVTITKFVSDGVYYVHDGEQGKFDPFNTVIVSTGMTPENSIANLLKNDGKNPIVIGDALKPADIFSATQSGYKAGADFI